MIVINHKGDFKKTTKFLSAVSRGKYIKNVLDRYGKKGVQVLSSVTPVDSGETANSWYYETSVKNGTYSIRWKNSHKTSTGVPVVILLQYGHGTRNGGYVEGRDFINPSILPIFDEISESVWREVMRS